MGWSFVKLLDLFWCADIQHWLENHFRFHTQDKSLIIMETNRQRYVYFTIICRKWFDLSSSYYHKLWKLILRSWVRAWENDCIVLYGRKWFFFVFFSTDSCGFNTYAISGLKINLKCSLSVIEHSNSIRNSDIIIRKLISNIVSITLKSQINLNLYKISCYCNIDDLTTILPDRVSKFSLKHLTWYIEVYPHIYTAHGSNIRLSNIDQAARHLHYRFNYKFTAGHVCFSWRYKPVIANSLETSSSAIDHFWISRKLVLVLEINLMKVC